MEQRPEPPRFVTLPEIRRAAKARLPRESWNFGDGGAETETPLRRNRRHPDPLAKAGKAPQMFQLYHHGDRGWVSELLARVEASGYLAVALPVDVQRYGRRERDILARFIPRKAMEIAPNPRGPNPEYQARLTWDDVEWLLKTTKLPVGLKGIMTVRDARRAVDMGVRLIWVSNHGGRQLDQTQSTIDALPPI